MKPLEIVALGGTVMALSTGQLLFKYAAVEIRGARFLWDGALGLVQSPAFVSAILLYGLATVVWVWILREVNLSVAYPVLGLTFILVPMAARVFFGENLNFQTVIGGCLILTGIWVIAAGSS